MSKQPINILSSKAALDDNYLLVLTTNTLERDAVRVVLNDDAPASIGRDASARLGRLGGHFCLHINGTAGAQNRQSIGSFVRYMTTVPMPKPKLILIAGFAWGNPALTELGDIVISSFVKDVNHQRAVGGIKERRTAYRESPLGSLQDHLHVLPQPKDCGRIHVGAIASAEIYLADDDERDSIIDQLPDVLGGEMEAFDLVRDLEVPWLFVKSVSDFGGNDTDRSFQPAAARMAAETLPCVISLLQHLEKLEAQRQDDHSGRLLAALMGQTVRIARPEGHRGDVLNAMNAEAPRLIERLSVYSSEKDTDGSLARTLAIAIIEIMQNAFLHGNASHADCSFTETKVTVIDDGHAYDPSLLVGLRGGSLAWNELRELFLNTGQIAFSIGKAKGGGNVYQFKLLLLSEEIRKAKRDCMLVSSGIRVGPSPAVFAASPGCETFYYEAIKIFTFSKIIDDVRDLEALLEAGKSLFVACRDERHVRHYTEALHRFAGSRLRIFVASRV